MYKKTIAIITNLHHKKTEKNIKSECGFLIYSLNFEIFLDWLIGWLKGRKDRLIGQKERRQLLITEKESDWEIERLRKK